MCLFSAQALDSWKQEIIALNRHWRVRPAVNHALNQWGVLNKEQHEATSEYGMTEISIQH